MLGSVLGMLEQGATHVGVATDHVIESFRNDLWPGYKTSEGMDPELLAQFPMLEDAAARRSGSTVWPMVEFEADDALASAAPRRRATTRGRAGVHLHARQGPRPVRRGPEGRAARPAPEPRSSTRPAVREKFGVGPASIPDYLALVGDTADGFPGLPGWGAKSAAAVLARYEHLDAIPDDAHEWDVDVRGAAKLATTLAGAREAAELFLDLATLRTDADVGVVDDWEWRGPRPELASWARRLGAENLVVRAERLAKKRFG